MMMRKTVPARRSRFAGRAGVVMRALARRGVGRRSPPQAVRRVLVAHHLLLGDTLMLTPLFAKLRERHPDAEIITTVAKPIAPLYATRPYGVRAIGWSPREHHAPLFDEAPFDLALVPGDNRFAWLAAAMDARWIVAFAGDRPLTKDLPVDSLVPYPAAPAAWGDMVAAMIDGPSPVPYAPDAWPAPPAAAFAPPSMPYAVLHVGASSALKQWAPERWRATASSLAARGLQPVLSSGPGEESLLDAVDPTRELARYAGTLSLAQLWHLVAKARLLVCPDTGVAHLGRITWTPTIALFGPGSDVLCGAGDFWRHAPYRSITVAAFPCRDQHVLFRREIAWVQRCGRTPSQCASPRCMAAIGVDAVESAIRDLLSRA